jgi:hypothetical protein
MTKDEALKGAIGAAYQKSPWDGKGISMPPPAAPDLQAELDATNRQVEILSDALAESRREVDALVALARADERDALMKETDKLRNRIAYLLQPPIVVAVGCFLFAYIVGFK